jgi:hypothetical protein
MTATLDAPAVREAYARDGFVVARRLFDPARMADARAEAGRLLVDYKHLMDTKNLRCRCRTTSAPGRAPSRRSTRSTTCRRSATTWRATRP